MKQLIIAIDQLLNTVVWIAGDGFGMADETLSARAWRMRYISNAWKRIDMLFFWQEAHCRDSYDAEVQRQHLPSVYRTNLGGANE